MILLWLLHASAVKYRMVGNFRGKSEKALNIMDSHNLGINFRGLKNFVTAKSTTKITKISTPQKLPTIRE